MDLQVKRWFTQLVCSYRLCWISVVRANSWCSIFQVLYYPLSHMAYRNSTRSFSSRGDEFCDWKSAVHGRQKAELDNQGLSCPGIVQIPQLPRTSAIFYFVVIRQCIRRRGIGKWQRKVKSTWVAGELTHAVKESCKQTTDSGCVRTMYLVSLQKLRLQKTW